MPRPTHSCQQQFPSCGPDSSTSADPVSGRVGSPAICHTAEWKDFIIPTPPRYLTATLQWGQASVRCGRRTPPTFRAFHVNASPRAPWFGHRTIPATVREVAEHAMLPGKRQPGRTSSISPTGRTHLHPALWFPVSGSGGQRKGGRGGPWSQAASASRFTA